MSNQLFLGLGSNLGDRRVNLRRALHALEAAGAVRVTAVSPVYETLPWGMTDQPLFLNLCAAGRTDLPPRELLQTIKRVEQEVGRKPAVRWGPRHIDVDILFYGDTILDEGDLQIPHPGIPERVFVLTPLAAIAPDVRHPQTGETVSAMLDALDPAEKEGLRRLPLPLAWGWRTHVMGVLNVTPDSFSGEGLMEPATGYDLEATVEAAVQRARQFAADGADVIDIGGQSTRPGSTPISAVEEAARALPVVRAVRRAVDLPISIDTYYASVAEAALEAGADWINDVWAMRMDPEMGPLAAAAGCPIVLTHNRSRPKSVHQEQRLGNRYVGVEYDDLIADVSRELQESVEAALAHGVEPDKIIVDPGIGFGKTVPQNLQLIDQLDRFKTLGHPLLIGPSRKSFIGYTLNLPPAKRLEGTAATVAIGIDRGADIVRVHDVRAMVRVARMTDAIVRRSQQPSL